MLDDESTAETKRTQDDQICRTDIIRYTKIDNPYRINDAQRSQEKKQTNQSRSEKLQGWKKIALSFKKRPTLSFKKWAQPNWMEK